NPETRGENEEHVVIGSEPILESNDQQENVTLKAEDELALEQQLFIEAQHLHDITEDISADQTQEISHSEENKEELSQQIARLQAEREEMEKQNKALSDLVRQSNITMYLTFPFAIPLG